ncbi:hypothetical protein LCGC14_1831800 [marine sediment metagenome]|uniref:Uncharacterized protein n=1 Tax=marine sediment metagenome TaxID=412755 RepID=A0A0F8W2N0_9ZZZZ
MTTEIEAFQREVAEETRKAEEDLKKAIRLLRKTKCARMRTFSVRNPRVKRKLLFEGETTDDDDDDDDNRGDDGDDEDPNDKDFIGTACDPNIALGIFFLSFFCSLLITDDDDDNSDTT